MQNRRALLLDRRQASGRTGTISRKICLAFSSTEFMARGIKPALRRHSGDAGALRATGRCSVLPRKFRRHRSEHRVRRGTNPAANLRQLEERELLSFSTLGYSLPDLNDYRTGRSQGLVGRRAQRLGVSPEHRHHHDHRAARRKLRRPRLRSRDRPTATPAPPMRLTRPSRLSSRRLPIP